LGYRNFDQSLKKRPKFRLSQIRSEIVNSLWALLVVNALTVPIFVAQVRGLAKIYGFGSYSAWYEVAQSILSLCCSAMRACIGCTGCFTILSFYLHGTISLPFLADVTSYFSIISIRVLVGL
jgi:hypothetical protein